MTVCTNVISSANTTLVTNSMAKEFKSFQVVALTSGTGHTMMVQLATLLPFTPIKKVMESFKLGQDTFRAVFIGEASNIIQMVAGRKSTEYN